MLFGDENGILWGKMMGIGGEMMEIHGSYLLVLFKPQNSYIYITWESFHLHNDKLITNL